MESNVEKGSGLVSGRIIKKETAIVEHDEIDILEPCGHQFEDASTNVVGWHDIDSTDCPNTMKLDEYKFTHDSPLSLDYHLF